MYGREQNLPVLPNDSNTVKLFKQVSKIRWRVREILRCGWLCVCLADIMYEYRSTYVIELAVDPVPTGKGAHLGIIMIDWQL